MILARYPDKGNTELAELFDDSTDPLNDKIEIKAQDLAQRRQALKKASAAKTTAAAPTETEAYAVSGRGASDHGRKRAGRKPRPNRGCKAASAQAAMRAAAPMKAASAIDVIESVFGLAAGRWNGSAKAAGGSTDGAVRANIIGRRSRVLLCGRRAAKVV